MFDDSEVILFNNDFKLEMFLFDLFVYDFWGSKLDFKISYKFYRFFIVLTFRWGFD